MSFWLFALDKLNFQWTEHFDFYFIGRQNMCSYTFLYLYKSIRHIANVMKIINHISNMEEAPSEDIKGVIIVIVLQLQPNAASKHQDKNRKALIAYVSNLPMMLLQHPCTIKLDACNINLISIL